MTDRLQHHSDFACQVSASDVGSITEADVLITDVLAHRPARQPDFAAENQAMRVLAQHLMDNPRSLLKRLVRIALELCQADTVGVSLLEGNEAGESVFRWIAIAGTLEEFEDGTTPANLSPCGTTIRCNQPQLYHYPERFFTYLYHPTFPVVEGLLIPLSTDDGPLGTLWIVSHHEARRFDAEDQRLMTSLGGFTASALQSLQQLQQSAATSLRQSEMFNQQSLDSSDDCIKVLDLEGRILFINQGGQALLGIEDMTPFIHASWIEFWQEAERPAAMAAIHRARTGEVSTIQGYCPTLSGEPRWWDNKISPIRGIDGQVERLLCISRDITERVGIENERKQSEEQLSKLFSQAAVGLSQISLDGKFQRVNDELCRILGRSREEILTLGVPDVTHPEDVPKSLEAFEILMQTGNAVSIDKRYLHSDGTIIWANSSLTRLNDEEGNVEGVLAVTIDLSERKQAEANLRESEERYRAIVNQALTGVAHMDLNGKLTLVNQKYCDITGYSVDELSQMQMHEITHPEDLPRNVELYHQMLVQGTPFEIEKRYIRKDGSIVWVNNYVSAICGPDGKPQSIVAIVLDITDRKQAEIALRQSEAHLRLMMESAKDYAIFSLDLNGTITSWNSGAERLLGYSEAEAIGCNGGIIFVPEDLERGQADRERRTALTQGRAENERWHVRKDGSRFWASGLMMPLQNEADNIQGFVKILQDKTGQRRANERFQLLYDTTSDLLATQQPLALIQNLFNKLAAQLELHCCYNFLLEEKDNQAMLHLRNYEGISKETAKEIEWIEIGEQICGLSVQQRQQIVLNQAQIEAHPKAGFIRSIGLQAYACQPLMAHGRVLGSLSFGSFTRTGFTPEEINLLQSTCEQIAIAIDRANLIISIQQQAEQLQQANRIKDEFLAVLSHELRSPLNPILGWTRLLQNGRLSPTRQAEALATIERNAKLQTQLIEDLLDVSRIMQGKLSLTVAPVSLTFVISAAVETVRLAAEAKQIQILLDLDRQIPPVSGDAARLQQVVWNLLTNAVKFTPKGGQVTVELRQLDQLAQIRVIDTGKGIDSVFLPHVFEYFRQADSTTTRQFGGLGLGLAIVRQIVETHGGNVQVESAGENRGAIFTVQLPILRQAVSAVVELSPARTENAEVPLNNLQILVVDDDQDTREFQAFLLEQNGARIIAVPSGLEALKVLDRFTPDVLVSDVGMADMDGHMLIRRIRSLPDLQKAKIPAIALTAYAGETNQQQVLAAGFQKHISKPIETEVLIQEILSLVRNS